MKHTIHHINDKIKPLHQYAKTHSPIAPNASWAARLSATTDCSSATAVLLSSASAPLLIRSSKRSTQLLIQVVSYQGSRYWIGRKEDIYFFL